MLCNESLVLSVLCHLNVPALHAGMCLNLLKLVAGSEQSHEGIWPQLFFCVWK